MTVAPLEQAVSRVIESFGVTCTTHTGAFDSILQESDRAKDYALTLIFWELCSITDNLLSRICLMSVEEINDLELNIKQQIELLFTTVSGAAAVFLNCFSVRLFTYSEITPPPIEALCGRLNTFLEERAPASVTLIDIDKVISVVSIEKAFAMLHFTMSGMLYTQEFFDAYATHIKPALAGLLGHTKKAIIFDCDNTLWSGVVGEDGDQGITMSFEDKRGSCFAAVQSIAVSLARRGVFVCLCSKNNFDDVQKIVLHHPDMQLRNQHIACMMINWDDKVTNIRAIAKKLNVLLESVLFVDDSPFEIELVNSMLPEVTTVQVPKQLHRYAQVIREVSAQFYAQSVTTEDLQRNLMQHDELGRQAARQQFSDIEDFLASLALCVQIQSNTAVDSKRAAQLTQRTNQFNLTTKRYTESDIDACIASNTQLVLTCAARDRFGSYGTVGVCVVSLDQLNNTAFIDLLLLSCRALGRKIEFAFFDSIMSALKSYGVTTVSGTFIATDKNEQTRTFYPAVGFVMTESSVEKVTYQIALTAYKRNRPDYILIT